ncbi:MAG: hypothetical protein ABXS92_08780, partial [Sulfurimonas sp.]
MQYIIIAAFFEWEEDDRVIFSYVYPGIVTAKLDERYSIIGVEGTGVRMHTKKLVRYANYGKSVLCKKRTKPATHRVCIRPV